MRATHRTNREVIVYTNKGDPFAYFAARMVEYYGGKHAKVYHGGIEDWKAAGKPLSTGTKLSPVALNLPAEGQGALTTKDVIERVRAGNAQIVDVRTPKEYSGEDIRAIRGGHVPGAVNIPYEQNWQDPATPAKLASVRAFVARLRGRAVRAGRERSLHERRCAKRADRFAAKPGEGPRERAREDAGAGQALNRLV
ncbi:MAG: thiosulfate sulfurtransferase [Proteobacteria bacterium]|nr:thiosulfate sulfurtransferase [Pseudomonadota bacterium]